MKTKKAYTRNETAASGALGKKSNEEERITGRARGKSWRTACEDHDPHRHGRSLGIYVVIPSVTVLLDEALRATPPPQDRHLDIPAQVSRGGSTRVILEIAAVGRKRHAELTDDMHKHQNQPGSGGA